MKKFIKITECTLSDGTVIKTIYFKKNSIEQEKIFKYLKSINAIEICTTFLENGIVYIDYYIGDN